MTRVWLLRHAEATDSHLFHGWESDVGLTPRGHQQARDLAVEFAERKPSAVICSGMSRAIETARPIADACRMGLRIETGLHERRIGFLSGTPINAQDGPWPETLRRWVSGDSAYSPTGAESFEELQRRVMPLWERLIDEYAGKSIVVVTHGVVCKVLMLSLLPGWSVADWHRMGHMRHATPHELIHYKSWKCPEFASLAKSAPAMR